MIGPWRWLRAARYTPEEPQSSFARRQVGELRRLPGPSFNLLVATPGAVRSQSTLTGTFATSQTSLVASFPGQLRLLQRYPGCLIPLCPRCRHPPRRHRHVRHQLHRLHFHYHPIDHRLHRLHFHHFPLHHCRPSRRCPKWRPMPWTSPRLTRPSWLLAQQWAPGAGRCCCSSPSRSCGGGGVFGGRSRWRGPRHHQRNQKLPPKSCPSVSSTLSDKRSTRSTRRAACKKGRLSCGATPVQAW